MSKRSKSKFLYNFPLPRCKKVKRGNVRAVICWFKDHVFKYTGEEWDEDSNNITTRYKCERCTRTADVIH